MTFWTLLGIFFAPFLECRRSSVVVLLPLLEFQAGGAHVPLFCAAVETEFEFALRTLEPWMFVFASDHSHAAPIFRTPTHVRILLKPTFEY